MFEYYEKMYLRCENDGEISIETFPLAFGIFDTQDTSFEKRKNTVDDWATVKTYIPPSENKPYSYDYKLSDDRAYIIDNKPISGHRIAGSVSRMTTDNKWIRISDPRGFTLEISTSNFCDLLSQTTVVNGVFQDKLVW